MNKLYSIHFYIKGIYYCESSTFYANEIKSELSRYSGAYLINDDNVAQIWRVDID